MERIIIYNLGENFIENLAAFLVKNFSRDNSDLRRIACVFGGKRPALFLTRELARKLNSSFFPPRTFSMDEFVEYIISPHIPLAKIRKLDASYLIYSLAKKHIPELLGRSSFVEFLPWADEIISFIEQLDTEDIANEKLETIQKSAAIGYDIPQNINQLLQNIIGLRDAYHNSLRKQNIYSRGLEYLTASQLIKAKNFDEFDAILFCNFFYLSLTEKRIIKDIYDKGKGICIFQGEEDEWSVLKDLAKLFNTCLKVEEKKRIDFNLFFYQGFDIHSQSSLVREVVNKNLGKKSDMVIVLPRPEVLIPLLGEVSNCLDEFNVSLGYPLARSSLYSLFTALFRALKTKRNNKYYVKDYLSLLRHPLPKNLKISKDSETTRVLVHKIEEFLKGGESSSVGGSLFLSLEEIENEEKIYLRASQTLKNMDIKVSMNECKKILKQLHLVLFQIWEEVGNFEELSFSLNQLLDALAVKSIIAQFPFNLKVMEKLYEISQEFKSLALVRAKFSQDEIWQIFKQKLDEEMISFSGSPLRGTQILGLWETRSLNFENVIFIDMNESVFPKVKICEPLIPREVMLSLGLRRLEKEEEIQRYQFRRLISGAKNVHLIYEERPDTQKSRFIEELIWAKQKEAGRLEIVAIPRARFCLKVTSSCSQIKKTAKIVEFLRQSQYSASKINTYLNCPLQFYYQYVLGLEEAEDLLQEPQGREVGTFIHKLLEVTFSRFINKKPLIDGRFKEYFFLAMEEKFKQEIEKRMKSDSFLLKRIIRARLERFLDEEEGRNVKRIICLEKEFKGTLDEEDLSFSFILKVDRIDELDNKSIVIIDYKTSSGSPLPKKLKELEAMEFNRRSISENIKSFQLPLYYYFMEKQFPHKVLNAELYNLRSLERKPFICEADYPNKERVMKICLDGLKFVLSELLNPDIPFLADRSERKCQFCPFNPFLCR